MNMKNELHKVSQSRVAQALAADYFSIYVVDPDTGHFMEYSSTGNYDSLGIEKEGEDFFGISRRNTHRDDGEALRRDKQGCDRSARDGAADRSVDSLKQVCHLDTPYSLLRLGAGSFCKTIHIPINRVY